jgi:hypothetical protein
VRTTQHTHIQHLSSPTIHSNLRSSSKSMENEEDTNIVQWRHHLQPHLPRKSASASPCQRTALNWSSSLYKRLPVQRICTFWQPQRPKRAIGCFCKSPPFEPICNISFKHGPSPNTVAFFPILMPCIFWNCSLKSQKSLSRNGRCRSFGIFVISSNSWHGSTDTRIYTDGARQPLHHHLQHHLQKARSNSRLLEMSDASAAYWA